MLRCSQRNSPAGRRDDDPMDLVDAERKRRFSTFPSFREKVVFPLSASEEDCHVPFIDWHMCAHGPAATLCGNLERLVRARYRGTCQQVPPKDRRYRQ